MLKRNTDQRNELGRAWLDKLTANALIQPHWRREHTALHEIWMAATRQEAEKAFEQFLQVY